MLLEDPTNPHAWLSRAKSNLLLAEKGGRLQGVLLEDLCFHAQQATEKALKAVFLLREMEIPKTHSLVRLMDLLESDGLTIPANAREADGLTQYAVQTRYPGWGEAVTRDEYRVALELAARVVFWVESLLV